MGLFCGVATVLVSVGGRRLQIGGHRAAPLASLGSRLGRHDRQIENDSDLIWGQIAGRRRREHHNRAHGIAADRGAFASIANRESKITAHEFSNGSTMKKILIRSLMESPCATRRTQASKGTRTTRSSRSSQALGTRDDGGGECLP